MPANRLCLFMLFTACCGHGDASLSDASTDTHNAYAIRSTSDLPVCDAAHRGELYFIEDDDNFRVCKASGWSKIDLRGEPGASGTTGVTGASGVSGAAGNDNRAAASLHCGGQLENTSIWFSYDAVLMTSGDVFASGSIDLANIQVSTAKYYSSQQVGAAIAPILMTLDALGTANAGYWQISVNRSTLITTIDYYDLDAVDGHTAWTMNPNQCTLNAYH